MRAIVPVFFFLPALCCIHGDAGAQNRILLLTKDDTSQAFVRIDPEPKGNSSLKYSVPPVPVEVSKAIPLKIDYDEAMNRLLSSFQLEHLSYGHIQPGYSLFATGNYAVLGAIQEPAQNEADHIGHLNIIKRALFGHKELLGLLYDWAMPLYQKAFALMSVPEQHDYLELLAQTKDYARTFDLKKEGSDLRTMGSNFASNKGKLSAFVYRRIANNELTREECVNWLTRAIDDLSRFRKTTPTSADNYVLSQQFDPSHFLACSYRARPLHLHGLSALDCIRVSDHGDLPFWKAPFNKITYAGSDFAMGILDNGHTDSSLVVLMDPDRTSEFVLPRLRDPDLGFAFGKRLLLRWEKAVESSDSVDAEEALMLGTQKAFTLVDLDSNRVVLDDFFVDLDAYALEDGQDPGRIMYAFGQPYIATDLRTGLKGVLDENWKLVLPMEYVSIEHDYETGEWVLNGQERRRFE